MQVHVSLPMLACTLRYTLFPEGFRSSEGVPAQANQLQMVYVLQANAIRDLVMTGQTASVYSFQTYYVKLCKIYTIKSHRVLYRIMPCLRYAAELQSCMPCGSCLCRRRPDAYHPKAPSPIRRSNAHVILVSHLTVHHLSSPDQTNL